MKTPTTSVGGISKRPDSPAEDMSVVEALINSRRPLRVSSPGNISSTRRVHTDKLLETLHTSLRQQVMIAPALESDDKTSSLSSPLSGAKTKSIGRKHEEPHAKKGTGSRRKAPKKPVPPAISRAHSRARESLTYISTLGIEKPRILEDMKRGELALARRQFKAASTRFTKVDKQAREVFKAALPDRLAQARDALRSLTKHRGKASGAKELFEAVEKAMDAGKYADAARHFRQAIRLIREGEHETVLRIMFSAKERFVLARKAGINIDGPLELMKISREKLKQGRLEEAVASAEAGQRLVEALLKKEHRSRGQLSECIKAIKVANLMGAGSEVLDERLNVVRAQFKSNELDGAYERARELTEIAKKAAYDKAASTYQMAEKALWMAKNLGLEDITDEDTLGLARQNLENDDTIQSFSLSTSVIVNTSSFILDSLNEKIKGVDQFAKGIEGEVMSLSEVQDAIEHTKERSVESFRKYSQLSEELVNQAFESAISYTRVSQDVIKEAFDNSVALAGDNATEGGLAGKDDTSTEIVSSSAVTPEDKRLRIVNLYLDGRITESQLERLLTLIDSSVAKVSLV